MQELPDKATCPTVLCPHIRGMGRFPLDEDLVVAIDEARVSLHGDLKHDSVTAMHRWFDAVAEVSVIELDELDIADGVACTEMVNLFRRLLSRQKKLVIRGAPQVLAHNLYRTGLLVGGRIVLQATREDEAYG